MTQTATESYHLLKDKWTLWGDSPQSRSSLENWSQNLKLIVSIKSIEEFWTMYRKYPVFLVPEMGGNYHFFKENIRPEWEDSHNQRGGKWTISFPRTYHQTFDNTIWIKTLMACIGNECDFHDDICGVVLSTKVKFYRITIWTRESDNPESCESIGRFFKDYIEIPSGIRLAYQSHEDSMKDGYHARDIYTL